jgi:hypothetical protein
MVNKKYLILTGLCAAMAMSPALAQETTGSAGRDMTYRGESYDVLDSSYVPGRRMDQHRRFLNNQYNFPAKPRNMWEIGLHVGQYTISGDVPALLVWQKGGYGLGLHIRKALGYIMSLRLDYTYGIGKGLQWQPSENYSKNTAWNAPAKGYTGQIFYNYKTEAHQLSLDLVASTNNIKFHKAKTSVAFYGFVGIGANAYQTWVNTTNDAAGGANYQTEFNNIIAKYPGGIKYEDRKDVRHDLQDMMDDSYETSAENESGDRRPGLFSTKQLNPVATFGLGTQFRISKRVNISLEDRVTTVLGTDEDLMDGQRWAEQTPGFPVITQNKDGINYFSIGLNFNLGGGSKNVEPLYWLNPLDYSYGELSNPRHMNLPEPVLVDSDGDGIADQFDKCPGTPAGVAVDSHGCPMDTDGDGVPDDRDKQLITPTECQPVDADGVGLNCPCHCEGDHHVVGCNIMAGSLMFSGKSSRITPDMQSMLNSLAAQMAASPTCRVVIMGGGGGSKLKEQLSWERVNNVIEYMSEHNNIDRSRFIFQYRNTAGVPDNSVMYRSANPGEEGPANEPPPHPDLHH